ncbi:hypothetical protein [Actinacidiphila alni]|uniref:hypothetical protein n=1 Tax=Actinacidiphila alni TaxID=380248 RepID=UPI00345525B0
MALGLRHRGTVLPDPSTFDGGSITVASDSSGGSTVTVDIPAADVQADQLPA